MNYLRRYVKQVVVIGDASVDTVVAIVVPSDDIKVSDIPLRNLTK
jgi:hypothetical protein